MYFTFCYREENQSKLDKYIVQKSNKSYIKINTRTKIPIKINRNKILVDMDNVNDFIRFIIKKDIHCSSACFCSSWSSYKKYHSFIIENKLYEHIELYIGKYTPFIQSKNKNYFYGIMNSFRCHIESDLFQFIVDHYDCDNIVYFLQNIFAIDPTFDQIELMLNRYRITLTEYFTNKNNSSNTYQLYIRDLYYDCAIYGDVEIFKYITAEIPGVLEDIDRDLIGPKLMTKYNSRLTEYKYDEGIRYFLLCKLTDLKEERSLEIYQCILTDCLGGRSFLLALITRATLNGHVEYLRLLFEVSEKDDDFYRYINNLLKKCNNKPVEIFELFIEYGADYKPHIKKLMKSAKNVGNRKLIEHLKHIMEEDD